MQQESNSNIPHWLTEVQQNSYLPELMISGTVIFSLNYLGKYVENFSMTIKQFLVMPGGAMIFIISSFVLFCAFISIKWGFITHFLLRAFWVSQIGLSYIYPDGANKDDIKQNDRFKKGLKLNITDNIIKLENWCSGVFSLMVLFSFMMLSTLLICIWATLFLTLGVYPGLAFLALFFLYFIDFLTFRKLRQVTGISSFLYAVHVVFKYLALTVIYRNIFYIYQSKIGKLRFNGTLLLLLVFGFFNAYPTVSRMQRWPNIFEFRDHITAIRNDEYEDRIEDNRLISFAALSSYRVTNDFSLFMVYTKKIHNSITDDMNGERVDEAMKSFWELSSRERGAEIIHLSKIQSDILTSQGDVMIDDKIYNDVFWVLETNVKTGQLGFRTNINTESLSKGFHTISIISTMDGIIDEHRVLAIIPFLKE